MARKVTKENEGFYKVLPRRLRELMAEHDGTHDDLAAILGVQRQTVTNYCNGVSSPTWESLVSIADYFDTSVDYLLGRTEAREPERADIRAICDYTGLSEKAVENLHSESHDKEVISAWNRFLGTDWTRLHRVGWHLAKAISFYRKDYVQKRSSRCIKPLISYFPEEMQADVGKYLAEWGGEPLDGMQAADYYASQAASEVKSLVMEAALGKAAFWGVRANNEYSDIEIYEE